jgi:signal transduction histidine kinase
VAKQAANAESIGIQVTDTGIGIPADRLSSIFEPFVQVHRTLCEANEGTGLGLAISRELARAMLGDLTVESEPGHGSTFALELPRAVIVNA